MHPFDTTTLNSIPINFISSIVVPAILVIAFLIMRFARSRFRNQVQAECWFCRATSFVPKGSENSFDCTACGQYNGFTENGDYNKAVPGQFVSDDVLECRLRTVSDTVFTSKSDILCEQCAMNQNAIIQRLSEFEPTCENLWDVELKNYKFRLEQLYPLCYTCLNKSKKRIKEVDAKLLPNFLNWWNSLRSRKLKKSDNASFPSLRSPPRSWFTISGPLYFLIRSCSLLCVCALFAGPFVSSLATRHCSAQTEHNLTLLDRLLIHFEPTSLRTFLLSNCTALLQWSVSVDIPILGQFCFSTLCIILQAILIHSHWRNHGNATSRWAAVVSPFILLLDVALLLIVSNAAISVTPKTVSKNGDTTDRSVRFYGYAIVGILVVPLIVSVCSGLSTWIRYCSSDWKAQKQSLIESWPTTRNSFQDDSQLANSNYSFASQSPFHYAHDPDPLEDFGSKLYVSSEKPLFRPSVFSCPPTWSPRAMTSVGSSVGSSAKRDSFYSVPMLPNSRTFPFLGSDHSGASDVSEITSVSRIKKRRASSVCGSSTARRRKPRSRKSYRRRSGLLRFCLSLLFGRIETWSDLLAELICLANALLVGIVIYGMGRLFVQIIEAF